jgi:hypothetical protein
MSVALQFASYVFEPCRINSQSAAVNSSGELLVLLVAVREVLDVDGAILTDAAAPRGDTFSGGASGCSDEVRILSIRRHASSSSPSLSLTHS